MRHSGTAKVRVEYVGKARMDGHDMPYLMASYVTKGDRFPRINPEGQVASGVMVASNEPMSRQMSGIPRDPVREQFGSSTPVTALQSTQAASSGGLQALEQFVALPEYGPIPVERPGMFTPLPGDNPSYAAAYADARVKAASSAFDVLLDGEGQARPGR